MRLSLTINGRSRDVDVPPSRTLLEVLRDTLGIFDVKEGCGEGVCGACTVLTLIQASSPPPGGVR